ncbi:nitroreductase [Prochlorococcus sp. MIT 1307]|uniref:nitroreductase family protein n=1 Tax=Prochlorococcus sp. MIT 1307 TaxID=3096219 RepID=UPI002A762E6F|nr:nitroreductase [Prochlorococcus sp. MIT 1307]
MDLQQALKSRRTIHVFENTNVPDQLIERAIEAANFAPCHRLTFPWRFTCINREKRQLLAKLSLEIKFPSLAIDQPIEKDTYAKYLNPSHLLIASQVLTEDPKRKKEDFAACACAIQNLFLSLVGDGVGSKWSTGKIVSDARTYTIVGIDPLQEEIIGFLWIGYGKTPLGIKRPSITSVFRR